MRLITPLPPLVLPMKDLLAGSIIQSSLLRRLLVDSFLIPFLISFMASRLLLILLLWLRSSSRKVGWVSEGEGNTFGEVEGLPHYQYRVLLSISPSSYISLYTVCIPSLHHIRPLHLFVNVQLSHLFIHSTLVSVSAAGFLFVAAEMEPTTPLQGGNRAARNRHDATPPFLRTSPPPPGGGAFLVRVGEVMFSGIPIGGRTNPQRQRVKVLCQS